MIDFYLKEYNDGLGLLDVYAAAHKYRSPLLKKMKMTGDVLKMWQRNKNRVVTEFVNKLELVYNIDERFLLFAPATNTRVFIDDLVDGIKNRFPNVVDLTDVFKKNADVSFGDAQFDNCTNDELMSFIYMDENYLKSINVDIRKIFILDDVYASGKSMELTKKLIIANLGADCEIKSGVILKIPKKEK